MPEESANLKIATSSIRITILSRFVVTFPAPIDDRLTTLIPCRRSTSRSKTSSFVSLRLDANSYNHLKCLRTCSFYLLGPRCPVKFRIEIIHLIVKWTNFLACWKWCIRSMFNIKRRIHHFQQANKSVQVFVHVMFMWTFFYLWAFVRATGTSVIFDRNFDLLLKKEQWRSR